MAEPAAQPAHRTAQPARRTAARSQQRPQQRPQHAATLRTLRAIRGAWLPPLLLLLLTLAAVTLAYTARPTVRIDVGGYYDSAFLPDTGDAAFHAREIGASAAGTPVPWPAASHTLMLPGKRSGVQMLTIRATPGTPAEITRFTALVVNDVRISIARRTDDAFVAVIPAEIAAAPNLTVEVVAAVNDGPPPPLGTVASAELASAETYRWSKASSTIALPLLGRGDWLVTLDATVTHPDGKPVRARVLANGTPLVDLPDRAQVRALRLLVPAALLPDGNLTLTLAAEPFNDPRPLGVKIAGVQLAPAGGTPLLPPLGALGAAALVSLGAYGALRVLTRRAWLAAALAALLALAGAGALVLARYPTAQMLPGLAWLALWSLALLALLWRALPWLFMRLGFPLSPWLLRALLLVFFAGYWLKSGAMLYPYFVGIDVRWHMDRALWLLDGRFWQLYGVNSPLNESTMPAAEWGANRPVIPYSPWFHIFALSFTLLPMPIVLTANLFSALLDSLRVPLIALLGRAFGLGERESLLAGLLYAVTPSTFLLLSWGNVPTGMSLFLVLLTTVYIVCALPRLTRAGPFITLTLLLLVTFLIYTFLGVLLGIFLLLLIVALLVRPPEYGRKPVYALALALLAASGLALLIYYGQYIGPIVERTIPYFSQIAQPGNQIEGVKRDTFGVYLAKYIPRMSYFGNKGGGYGLLLTLPLGVLGWAWLRGRVTGAVLLCMSLVSLLFLVAGARVSMVDKHLFYLVPALCIGVGALAGRLLARGWGGRLLVLALYAMTFAAAVNLWIYRVIAVRQ